MGGLNQSRRLGDPHAARPNRIGEEQPNGKMALFGRKKDRERFYLLPGMGGRALRKKNLVFLRWAIIAGILVSGVLACLLYLMNRGHR